MLFPARLLMAIQKSEFSLQPLKLALASLEAIVNEPKTDIVRDAVIQRFEYTFELSWKSLKRYFEIYNSLSEDNIKNLIREAGRQGLIDSVEAWFEFHKARHLTSHTYSLKVAEQVYETAVRFAKSARVLLDRLDTLNG
jgi:nucleotidyltransferase substrate binding protein (TIGR01987 family)